MRKYTINSPASRWVVVDKLRPLNPIGYIPPAEAEANYWRQLAQQAETASST